MDEATRAYYAERGVRFHKAEDLYLLVGINRNVFTKIYIYANAERPRPKRERGFYKCLAMYALKDFARTPINTPHGCDPYIFWLLMKKYDPKYDGRKIRTHTGDVYLPISLREHDFIHALARDLCYPRPKWFRVMVKMGVIPAQKS